MADRWQEFLLEQGGRFSDPEEPGRLVSFGDPAGEMEAAATGSLLADATRLARLRLRGSDAKDFIHRLTTNDIEHLNPGEGAWSLFLTPKGRVLDLVLVLVGEEEIILVGAAEAGEGIRSRLDRYLFREEVGLSRIDGQICLGLYGRGAPAAIRTLAGPEAEGPLAPHHFRARIQNIDCRVMRSFPLGGAGFLISCPAVEGPRLWRALTDTGSRPAGEEALERLRIEAGIPAPGRELSENYNPWEVRLDQAISLTKGCYVGQEVVARLFNYQKIQRRLAGLTVASPSAPPSECPVRQEGRQVGVVTSSAPSSNPAETLALAMLQLPHPAPEKELTIETPEGGLLAHGRSLPFSEGTEKL